MTDHHHAEMTKGSYWRFGLELVIDLVVMYLVMYTMIATLGHFYLNLNNVYMTLMMVAPMALIMLISMRSMFPSRRATGPSRSPPSSYSGSASGACGHRRRSAMPSSSAR